MNKDRGNIKWTAMMLPEHVEMVKQLWRESEEVKKPILEEQQLEEIDQTVCEAIEHCYELHFTYYTKGKLQIVVGYVHYLDHLNKKIHMKDKFGEVFIIGMEDIIKVNHSSNVHDNE